MHQVKSSCLMVGRCCEGDPDGFCCYYGKDESPIPPLSKEFDPHAVLQDLRCIHGLAEDALLHVKDVPFEDVVRCTYEDHQRWLSIQDTRTTHCCPPSWEGIRRNGGASNIPFQQLPLMEDTIDPLLFDDSITVASLRPDYGSSQRAIAVLFFIVVLINACSLLFMHVEGLPLPVFRITRASLTTTGSVTSPSFTSPSFLAVTDANASIDKDRTRHSNHTTLPALFSHWGISDIRGAPAGSREEELPPKVDWTKYDYNFRRFDVFFPLINLPVPLIFGIMVLCLKSMMFRLSQMVCGGLCEYIRRTVHMCMRQAIDRSFHDFLKRIEFFFDTRSELKTSGKPDLHGGLHRAVDGLHSNELRFDHSYPHYPSRYAIRPVLHQALAFHRICFNYIFYYVPILIAISTDIAISTSILQRTIFHGWRSPPIKISAFHELPNSVLENEGFRYILMVICFHFLLWFWILILTADDFSTFMIYSFGFFDRARQTAVEHTNYLIARIWDVSVVQGVLPFIVGYKSPDLQWGDAVHQISHLLQQVQVPLPASSPVEPLPVSSPVKPVPASSPLVESKHCRSRHGEHSPDQSRPGYAGRMTGGAVSPLCTQKGDCDGPGRYCCPVVDVELQRHLAQDSAEAVVRSLDLPEGTCEK